MQHRPQRTSPAPALRLWPAAERSIGQARDWLTRTADEWGLDGDLADAAALVLSELLTNALRYARPTDDGVVGSEIGTRLVRQENGLRIEVHDASDRVPVMASADPLAEHGRGLVLVDALTLGQWGVGPRDGIGKLVWAHVPSHR
ncbi:ATP-binding protein [Actinacidiphila alni]|uniref:ATP-binding protein n=1 Tax=Actinacidiphila alni TaxID=380248 RepID=UPI0033D842C1